MSWLALDIGGANLKAADGLGYAAVRPFALWRNPDRLAANLAEVLAQAPAADRLAVTMTGELADCFVTKAEGVRFILAATASAAGGRETHVYLTDGSFGSPEVAQRNSLLAAASNWHALARFAARYLDRSAGLLVDLGSTTCDIIPLRDGRPAAHGATDPDRLASGELVYTGVVRSPLCAVANSLPWRGHQVPTAHELFATTLDAYLTLEDLPEDPGDTQTADGRPATRAFARDRLARSICADREMFGDEDALAAARAVERSQSARIAVALQNVARQMPAPPAIVAIAGQGEFLLRRILARLRLPAAVISLSDQLGPELSRVAPAHALATLAREWIP